MGEGSQGSIGESGIQGNIGEIGSQGIVGNSIQGTTGSQGEFGIQGIIGESIQGTQGKIGESIQGSAGYIGEDGTQGVQGTDGSQGIQGVQGGITPGGEFAKDYEFCVSAGFIDTFILDIYAWKNYTVQGCIIECDQGTLDALVVKIDGTAIIGLNDMDVNNSPAVFTATENNLVAEGGRLTLVTSVVYTGTPTVIRVKLVCL